MTQTLEGALNASGLRVAIVVSRFNDLVTERLLRGAEDCLDRHGASSDDRVVYRVPGAWEIPQTVRKALASDRFDAVVTLGCLIRGETPHFEHISAAVTRGLASLALDSDVPIIYGVLTADTVDQAVDRAGVKLGNKGWEAALSAIEMAGLFRRMT